MKTPSLDDNELQRRLVESRALEDAPESLVLEAIAIWDKSPRQPVAQAARRLLTAVLAFDNWGSPGALAGVRAQDDGARQLMYTMGDRDIDLRIRRSVVIPDSGWTVRGQVLGADEQGRTHIRCGAFEASTVWSDQCEFHFEPVPDGECFITLVTDEWEAVLPAFALPPPP